MKAMSVRAFRISLFAIGLLLAAIAFAFGCEALQLAVFVPEQPIVQPSYPMAAMYFTACGAMLFCVFKNFLE